MLKAGVKFRAALGNHDDPNQRMYKGFNMNGERFYTFRPRNGVRFFCLDSNYLDRAQIEWLEKELSASGSDWKIAYFHHPLYSSGEAHGPDEQLRAVLEPLFLKHGVAVVFTGGALNRGGRPPAGFKIPIATAQPPAIAGDEVQKHRKHDQRHPVKQEFPAAPQAVALCGCLPGMLFAGPGRPRLRRPEFRRPQAELLFAYPAPEPAEPQPVQRASRPTP